MELCDDSDRVSSLVEVHSSNAGRSLLVDLSRQKMTLETVNHLLRLATAREVVGFARRLTRKFEEEEERTSHHVLLRAPPPESSAPRTRGELRRALFSEELRAGWKRVEKFSDNVRGGLHR